jgi:hypothetical protein
MAAQKRSKSSPTFPVSERYPTATPNDLISVYAEQIKYLAQILIPKLQGKGGEEETLSHLIHEKAEQIERLADAQDRK